MEFRLLGPLEVRRDGSVVAVGGAKQRALLTILLLHANEVVSRDRLIDELWSDRALGTSGATLDHQVSRLRKALAPAEMISTRPGGYMLEVEDERIDAFRFERLLEDGRRANLARKPSEASAALESALALWRGEALAEFAYQSFARVEAERLEELRLVANEELFDARLALGQRHMLVSEIESLAAKHPLRERLHAQLMLALYRSGRQAEALGVYTDVRRRLVDELGLEPGPELQRLEQAILRQDATLDAVSRSRAMWAPKTLVAALALVATAGAAAVGVLVAQGGRRAPMRDQSRSATRCRFSQRRVARCSIRLRYRLPCTPGSAWGLSGTSPSRVSSARSTPSAETAWSDRERGSDSVRAGVHRKRGLGHRLHVAHGGADRSEPGRRDEAVQAARVTAAVLPGERNGRHRRGSGSIWVGQGTDNPSRVYRVDPETGDVQKTIVIPEGGAGATFGHGAVWVAGGVKGRLSRIDPHTNAVTVPSTDFGQWMLRRRRGWVRLGSGRRHDLEDEPGRQGCEQHEARRHRHGSPVRGRSGVGVGRGCRNRCPGRSDDGRNEDVQSRPRRFGRRRSRRCPRSQCPVRWSGRDRRSERRRGQSRTEERHP